MIIYLLNIFLIMLFGSIFLWYKPSSQNKKLFCILVTIQLILLSGLRHISIGADTYSYKVDSFDITIHETWRDLVNDFVNIIFKGADGKDPGYHLFEKLIQIFSTNYQVFLMVIALIFTIPLGVWIYKNSIEPCMSFLIYSCLFSSFFTITGLRQTIATALVVLIGYKFIKERKFWSFLVLILVAFTIHKSAICFFQFYFIANKTITKKYLVIMSFVIIMMFIFRNQVMAILGNLMGYEQYISQYEGAAPWNFTTLLLILTIITVWKYKMILKNNLLSTHYINALLVAFVFVPLTFIDPTGMRVVQYYSIFIMLLVPEVIKSFSKRERVIVYYIAATLLIVLYVKNNPQYLFFWQG